MLLGTRRTHIVPFANIHSSPVTVAVQALSNAFTSPIVPHESIAYP